MKILLLGGNSVENKNWLYELKENLKNIGEITVHEYSHWNENNKKSVDIDEEISRLQKFGGDLSDTLVLAKSAGVVLTLKGVNKKRLSPKACVFLGTPVSWAKENNYDIETLLEGHQTPTLYIQNKNDPAISADNLKKILDKNKSKNKKFEMISGDTHYYGDYKKLHELILAFINNL